MEPTLPSPEQRNTTGTVAASLNQNASIQNIFGAPIEAQGKTIIPVAQVALGLGGGYGLGRKEVGGANDEEGEGAGAGAGLLTIPKGVFVITAKKTRFIPVSSARPYYLGAAVGLVVGWLLAKRKKRPSA
ncbi:spore germination protein GerW family protein [Rufibacter ruber]|uniref:spore germination protein GerW family protein n=1 Tax=Rufibacter ruber TaxID=1783499 RepID=UPI0008327415|nr:spore germination protein GerW family protein [Rufibacter ruber]